MPSLHQHPAKDPTVTGMLCPHELSPMQCAVCLQQDARAMTRDSMLEHATDAAQTRCKSWRCNADIIFAVDESSGRPRPLDATPISNGNVEVRLESGELVCRTLPAAEARARGSQGDLLWMPHHATCRDVGAFRK